MCLYYDFSTEKFDGRSSKRVSMVKIVCLFGEKFDESIAPPVPPFFMRVSGSSLEETCI